MSDFSDDAQREYGEALAEGKMDKQPHPTNRGAIVTSPNIDEPKTISDPDPTVERNIPQFVYEFRVELMDTLKRSLNAPDSELERRIRELDSKYIALFESHLNRAVVEARIDEHAELNKILESRSMWTLEEAFRAFDDRTDQLKANLQSKGDK